MLCCRISIFLVLVGLAACSTTAPIPLELPADDLAAYEGKLVTLAQPMWVADSYNLERYGTLLLYAGESPRIFTSTRPPDAERYAEHQADFAARSLLLEDGSFEQNVTPIRYLTPDFADGSSRPIRVGDRVTSATGVLRYTVDRRGGDQRAWRLVPTEPVEFEATNPRPSPIARTPGIVRVAGINALNAFFTLDRPGASCGPSGLDCRGANTTRELERQFDKLAAGLAAIDADVYAVMEVENDDGAALDQISSRLSARRDVPYAAIDTGPIGTDAIRVGLIYNYTVVRPLGEFAVLDSSVDDEFIDTKNRPVLAQAFQTRTGETFVVAVNHLKSKGSDCDELGDPDRGDGQGNCNRTRARAADAEIRWLATDPTGSGDPDVLVIGDLNAYRYEDPLRPFADAGYVNLVERDSGEGSYSFVFRGEAGALDHALASPSLAGQVVSTVEWHVNADVARVLDYNLDFDRYPVLFSVDEAYRFSDHDPVIVDILLDSPSPAEGNSP